MAYIDGEKLSNKVIKNVQREVKNLDADLKIAFVLVGHNKASEIFISEKEDVCNRIGVESSVIRLEEDISQEKLIAKIRDLNNSEFHGILIQLPLPKHIESNEIFETLDSEKDVDGLTPKNLGNLLRGEKTLIPGTVKAVEYILRHYNIDLEGKEITIVNNSNLIGKPLSMILTNKFSTVTICHEKTKNLSEHTSKAEIVVTATGQPGLIEPEMVKESSIVLDAGYARENGKTKGDTTGKIEKKCSLYTPVPGGIGPLTVAMTMKNLLKCYKLQQNDER